MLDLTEFNFPQNMLTFQKLIKMVEIGITKCGLRETYSKIEIVFLSTIKKVKICAFRVNNHEIYKSEFYKIQGVEMRAYASIISFFDKYALGIYAILQTPMSLSLSICHSCTLFFSFVEERYSSQNLLHKSIYLAYFI